MGKLDGKVAIVTGLRVAGPRLCAAARRAGRKDRGCRSEPEIVRGIRSRSAGDDRGRHGGGNPGRWRQCDRYRGRCLRRDGRRCHGSAGVRRMGARGCAGRQRGWRTRAAGRYQGEHARSVAVASGHQHEPVRHCVLLQRRCADHEAAAVWQDRHGEFGRGTVAFVGWRLCALRRSQGGDRALHAVPGTGSRAVRHYRELYRAGHHHHRAHCGDGDAGQCGCQSRPDGSASHCVGSARSRTAPGWWSSWSPISPTT